MKQKNSILLLLTLVLAQLASAQQIVYSETEREDNRKLKFEVIGKIGGQFLIFKNNHNKSWISVLDNNMNSVDRVNMDFLPADERIINIDFFPYSDRALMIYQYQKKNVVYCMAAKLDPNGKLMEVPRELDTTHISASATNQLYSVISTDDKKKIAVFKINSKNKSLYWMTTSYFNDQLVLLGRSKVSIPMEEQKDEIGEFAINNEGDLFFPKLLRQNGENIVAASLLMKPYTADTLFQTLLDLNSIQLDEIKLKVDNNNKRIVLASLYAKEKRGNIEGYYFYCLPWNNLNSPGSLSGTTSSLQRLYSFSDEIRRDANRESTTKTAFNDFYIKQIIIKRDGSFIIASEANYTTSRNNNFNRWDYYPSPYAYPGYGYYSPYYNRVYNANRSFANQQVRYHSDNIVVQSFGKELAIEWSTVITKSQFDDETEDLLSFSTMNTGGELHFLFDQSDRRDQLMVDFIIKPGGETSHNSALKNLDRGYDFMPRHAKQVSAHQFLIPCVYRNYICFAKLEYN